MLRQTGLSLLASARGAEATMRGPLLAATCQVNERGRGESPSPPPSCRRKGKGFSSKRELRLRELAGGSRLLMLRAEGALQMFDRGPKCRASFFPLALRLERASQCQVGSAGLGRKGSRLRLIEPHFQCPPSVRCRLLYVTELQLDIGSVYEKRWQVATAAAMLFERGLRNRHGLIGQIESRLRFAPRLGDERPRDALGGLALIAR